MCQLEAMAQSHVADAAAAVNTDDRLSLSLSALDICCHGTFRHPCIQAILLWMTFAETLVMICGKLRQAVAHSVIRQI